MAYINGNEVLYSADVNLTNVEVVQETGNSETAVMSQKAVTDALANFSPNVSIEQYHGNIISLGYTTFAECKELGYYSFKTTDIANITDAPTDLETAGNCYVTPNSAAGVIYQLIIDNNGSVWFRYSTKTFTRIIDYINGKKSHFLSRGNVCSLGYTTFAECKGLGYYSFKTTDIANITDTPENLESAGNCYVFSSSGGGSIFQFVSDLDGNVWFRYSTKEWTKISRNDTHIKWCALGDSITQGYISLVNDAGEKTYTSSAKDGWASKLAKNKSWKLTNKAIGGTGYLRKHDNAEDAAWNTVQNIDFTQFDFVTLAYGVNDWKYNQVLGTFEDDYTTPTSIYGAMRKTIETIIASNPLCKIFVITPINCATGGTEATNWGLGYSYSNNGTLEEIFNAIKTVCEYYGIEMIDMTHSSIVNRKNITSCLLDNVHPTAETHTVMAHELGAKIMFN